MKTILAVLVALFALTSPVQAQTVDEIIKRGKVIIAVDPTSGPFGVTGPDGKPDGYDVDVAKLVAKFMGVQLELVPVTSVNRIPYLLTNRVDMVISLFAITPERALQVGFSIPYARAATVLTTAKERTVKSFADLSGMRIGVPRGTIPDLILTQKALPGVTILRFDDEATSIQALQTGQIDALGSSVPALRVINRGSAEPKFEPKLTLVENHFGIGTRRTATDLRDWLNTMIYVIKNNGDLNAISQKWIGEDLPALPVF